MDRILYPKQEGETKLIAEFMGKRVEVPVKVAQPNTPSCKFQAWCDASFHEGQVVIPVLAMAQLVDKTDSCFHSLIWSWRRSLSHNKGIGTRRINLAVPEKVCPWKGYWHCPYTGGKLFSKNSKHWHTLVDWLKDGQQRSWRYCKAD